MPIPAGRLSTEVMVEKRVDDGFHALAPALRFLKAAASTQVISILMQAGIERDGLVSVSVDGDVQDTVLKSASYIMTQLGHRIRASLGTLDVSLRGPAEWGEGEPGAEAKQIVDEAIPVLEAFAEGGGRRRMSM